MKGPLVGFRRGTDIVVIAIFGILLCISRASAAALSLQVLHFMRVVYTANELPSSETTGVSSSGESVCRTKGCLDAAKSYLKNIDRSVDPCDNFYKFACGGFVKSTVIPGDKTSLNPMGFISSELQTQLRTSIELPIQANEPKPVRLVKNFYKACMDEDAIETGSVKSLHEILNKFGGWPVVSGDQWSDGNFDWMSSIYKVRDAGYDGKYLIDISIFLDMKTTTKRSIYIDHPIFSLPDEYLAKGFEDKFIQEYYKYMVDFAVVLGANKERAMTELKESLLFELKLFNISTPEESRKKDVSLYYHPMTFSELKKNYPCIPWADYFAKLLPSSDALTEDEVVIVSDQNYIANLVNLIDATSYRVLANHVMWRIVIDSTQCLNRDIRARKRALMTVFKGSTGRKPRWKVCINAASRSLPLGVGALYVRSYFSEDAKMNAVKIIMDIKEQFAEMLRKVKWMDDTTRKGALEKLAAMSSIVAYSDEILNVDKLEKYYENLELSGENYLESFLNCSLFKRKKLFAELHKPVVKNDWTTGNPTLVNAMYSTGQNSIEIPAGILQGAFFGNDRPKYTNYGTIGFVIGHEITHGFDRSGSKFDKNGNLANWWATTTRENFDKRAECLIHQYGNYTVDEIGQQLNGEKTLNENIADNGGMKAAYLAYTDWISGNPPEKQLPGLNYTSKQMFWISAANSWCTKYTKKMLRHRILVGGHTPAEFRIVGTLSNMPQFSKDFNCPIGSKMNPINKCSVW